MSEEIAIDTLSRLIDRCKECKFATCENCEISWNEVQSIKGLFDLYKELKSKINEYEKQLDLDYVDNNYINKDKVKEKINFLKEVLAFAETGRDEKATIQANLLKNIIIEMEKLLED